MIQIKSFCTKFCDNLKSANQSNKKVRSLGSTVISEYDHTCTSTKVLDEFHTLINEPVVRIERKKIIDSIQ